MKEKLLAAHRFGINQVIIPKENEKDLIDIPKKVREDIKITVVENVDEVLKIALKKELKESSGLKLKIFQRQIKIKNHKPVFSK